MILSYRVMIFAAEIPKRLLFQLWAPQTECHRAPSYLREGRRLLDGGTAQRVRGKVWVFHSGLNWTFNFACLELRIRWGLEERCSSGVTTRSKAAVCKIIVSDQKHLSQSSDPILGLWVNCGPRWIRLQDLASWLGSQKLCDCSSPLQTSSNPWSYLQCTWSDRVHPASLKLCLTALT